MSADGPDGHAEGQVEGGLPEPEELEPDHGTLDLAGPSTPATRADWEKAAAAVLRKSGRLSEDDADDAVWEKLTHRTLDGLAVTPLGTADLVEGPASPVQPVRPAGEGWDVRAQLADPEADAAAESALTDLENGVTSLWLRIGPGGTTTHDLAVVLEKVLLDVAPVVLDAPSDPMGAARRFAEMAEGTTLAPGSNLGVDPVGARLRGHDVEDDAATGAVSLARDLGCRALVVDGTAVHDLGASDVQELGYVLATGAQYLRLIERAGVDLDEVAGLVELRLAATDEQVPTIAKLRAARRLWSRVLELSGVSEDRRTAAVHAVTSRPMMTRYDPWVNMLRTCVAAFSAGVGGADAVTVLPFDLRLGVPDAFARRIARNTSALLVEESHVAKVADPAAGAFAIEQLTDDVARAAWEELGRLESAGGVVAALDDGSLSGRIEQVVAERDRQIALRSRPLTGLTEFPHLHETLPERRAYPGGEDPGAAVRPYGERFEALRDEPADQAVFLATMGSVAAHTARASFATNLFAVGGIDVVNTGRHDDVAAVVEDYSGPDGGQPVVCLAGPDQAYAEWGADLVAALREAGARHVILAGKPVEGVEVDDHCAMGVDALDFLTRTRGELR